MHPEFDLSPDLCYLNHAAVAPWPRRAVAAVTRFAEANGRRGSSDYAAWLATEQRLRERLADLIQAPSTDDIALVKNTSEGLSILAQGLDWQSGRQCGRHSPGIPLQPSALGGLARSGGCLPRPGP